MIFGKHKELKIFRHSEVGAPELFKTFNLSAAKNLSEIHTVVLPKFTSEKLILFTATNILVLDLGSHQVESKYQSFNLQPYNIQVINTKYLYFQSLEGVCLLNLKALAMQAEGAQEVLLQRTYNSTNQIQYDPRFDRLLYFSDFETVHIITMPHKNIIVPFGFNRLSGKFGQESVDACFVTSAPHEQIPGYSSEQMFKRLVAVTKSKKVIAWEYPTGQFIE